MTARAGRLRALDEGGGLVLFRVRGVPVLLSPSWWIGTVVITLLYAPLARLVLPGVSALVAVGVAAMGTLLLGVFVMAHELGHCLVALRMGIPVRRLRLFLLGGLTEVGRSPRGPGQEGWVAAAGPAVSVGLAAVFGLAQLILRDSGLGGTLLWYGMWINITVAAFNLLPGLPLDGGRMLRAGMWALTGRRRLATRAAVAGGALVAIGLVVWAITGLVSSSPLEWLQLGICVLTAWFVATGASSELAAERRREWPDGLRLAQIVRPVLQLPAESPVADALVVAAGRGVVLVRQDGVAAGLLDEVAAHRLAMSSPRAPAEQAAYPIRPDTVLFATEPGEEIAMRVRETAAWQFLVVDDDGRPSGVLLREDLRAALQARGIF